ncbi:DUF5522 domain-containing protein [Cyclobacterium marinum]|uniref:DUF5522 domain-containing protein n=1 Tax=Cyclobacterium marinum TaxID=104 RepID=UPI0002E3C6E0|nr:DUF5522 domain-containing protein [Cyclobacterium marinum]MBI0398470.1 hypothetical protein [Cyclobacterium marinum]MBR9774477.1 hypothetical protein [Cytophagales bacterium]
MKKENKLPPPHLLKEGFHYYYEGGLMVFTEDYHLQRGNCCGNNCRHCPYPKRQQKEN